MKAFFHGVIPAGLVAIGATLSASTGGIEPTGAAGLGDARVGADCDPVNGSVGGTPKCSKKASACVGRGSFSACVIDTWNTACASEPAYTPGGTGTVYVKNMTCSGYWWEGWCAWDFHDSQCRWFSTTGIFWCPGGKDVGTGTPQECTAMQPGVLPNLNPNYHPQGI